MVIRRKVRQQLSPLTRRAPARGIRAGALRASRLFRLFGLFILFLESVAYGAPWAPASLNRLAGGPRKKYQKELFCETVVSLSFLYCQQGVGADVPPFPLITNNKV